MKIPGLEEVNIEKIEQIDDRVALYISLPVKPHPCPACNQYTTKVHDYRIRKIKHLKFFERLSVLFYRRRRYKCACGKRFSEEATFVKKYQRFSKEWNQTARIRSIKAKTFKDAAQSLGTSSATIMRRFKEAAKEHLKTTKRLPKRIAIDEYKGDTNAGKFQLIIADADTHEPIDILPNRKKDTIKEYLFRYGAKVELVVTDMNSSFKSAIREALGRPVIVADRFHFCRYIYWAIDEVRRKVQKDWHAYDRKKCKRMRHVLYKREKKLSSRDLFYVKRYTGFSSELLQAYELKNAYCRWFDWAKEQTHETTGEVKKKLYEFYQLVEESGIYAFQKVVKTFKNWEPEILNSFVFDYSNGFLEGINNTTKVMKRTAYGYRKFEHMRAKVLLNHQLKNQLNHLVM